MLLKKYYKRQSCRFLTRDGPVKDSGSSIMPFLLILMLLCVAMMSLFIQMKAVRLKIFQVQDGLAAACLAAATPDVYTYQSTGDLYIPESKVPSSYVLFLTCLKANVMVDGDNNDYHSIDANNCLTNLSVQDFRVYSVIGANVEEYQYNIATGTTQHLATYTLASGPKTPNGKLITATSVYAKLSITLRTAKIAVFLKDSAASITESVEKVSAIVKDGNSYVLFKDWKMLDSSDNEAILLSKYYPGSTTAGDIVFPPPPVHDGYTFVGWSMSAADIAAQITAGASQISVNAVYEAAAGNVSLKLYNGNTTKWTAYAANTSVTVSAVAKDGKMFGYWSSDKSGKNFVSSAQTYTFTITKNSELYAIYIVNTASDVGRISNTVTPEANGVTVETTYYINNSAKTPSFCGAIVALDQNDLNYNNPKAVVSGSNITTAIGTREVFVDYSTLSIPSRPATLYVCSYIFVVDKTSGAAEIVYGPVSQITTN
jgi:hypothetical protein